MSIPYFPMYPTDFEADTSHLSFAEDGAYNRLLRVCWMTPGCSVPADEAWVFRRLRAVTEEDKEALRYVISEFFETQKNRWVNARLSAEFEKATAFRQKQALNGAKGGRPPKSLETNETGERVGLAKKSPPEPEPEPEEKRTTKVVPKKTGKRLSEDWVLPREWGQWALDEGWSESVVRLEADKFKDFWLSKAGKDAAKLDWLRTWRNWMRNSKTMKGTGNGKDTAGETGAEFAERIARQRAARHLAGGADQNAVVPLLPAGIPAGRG